MNPSLSSMVGVKENQLQMQPTRTEDFPTVPLHSASKNILIEVCLPLFI